MDIETNIHDLKAIVDGAAASTETDGVKTTYDLAGARRRLLELKRKKWAAKGHRRHPYLRQAVRVSGGSDE